jgi:hypothetical protein
MSVEYDPYAIPEAHDQPLGIRGARRDGLIKYDSNLVAAGDHNEVQGHHSNIEDGVNNRLFKYKVNIVGYKWTELPYLWRSNKVKCLPQDDPTFGQPSDIAQFLSFKEDGRYLPTDIHDISAVEKKFSEALDKTVVEGQKVNGNTISDSKFFELISTVNTKEKPSVTCERFIKFFGGNCPHINSLDQFFTPKEVNDRRFLLQHASKILSQALCDQVGVQFNTGLLVNWASLNAQNMEAKDCYKEQPCLLRLFGVIKSAMDLPGFGIKKQSVITHLRLALHPFFKKWDRTNLSEIEGEGAIL